MTAAAERVDVDGEGRDGRGGTVRGAFMRAKEENEDERGPLEIKTAADADAIDVRIALDLACGALDCDREGGCAKREGEGEFGQWIGVDHGDDVARLGRAARYRYR